ASAGDEIWVAEGTYRPDAGAGETAGDRAATFQLASGVEVYGGFAGGETDRDQRDWVANPTILSGDIGTAGVASDNSYHVVTGSGAAATAILDGFTITSGYAHAGVPNDRGAGIFND